MGTVDASFYNRNGGAPTNLAQLESAAFTKSFDTEGLPYIGVTIDLNQLGVASFAHVSTIQFGSLGAELSVDPVLFMGINSAAAVVPGDFNQDGTVDAADYGVWRNGLGTTNTQADYDVWRSHFGQAAASGTLHASVPEPSSAALSLFALAPLLLLYRAHHSGLPGWKHV